MRMHGHTDYDPCIDEGDEEVAHLELLVPVTGVAIDKKAESYPLGQEPHRGFVEVVGGSTGSFLPSATAIEGDIEMCLV
jgi:hypothetical protein